MSDTMETVRTIIVQRMGRLPGEVHDGATWEDLGMNFGTVADLVAEAGEVFAVTLSLADLAALHTVGDLVRRLESGS